MALTFYYGSGSPYSWRVYFALEYKQLEYAVKLVSFSAGDTKTPEFLAQNPRGQVPVLVDDDFALYESNAIVEYLDDRYPEQPLFGAEPRRRAVVRRLICENDWYLTPSSEKLVDELFYKSDPATVDEQVLAAAKAGIGHELQRFETYLTNEWLAGELSAADFALYPTLALFRRFEKRRPDLGLTAAIPPKLAAWVKRIEALPYYDKTYPPHWR